MKLCEIYCVPRMKLFAREIEPNKTHLGGGLMNGERAFEQPHQHV